MLNSYEKYEKPKSKFQLAKEAKEAEINNLYLEAKAKREAEKKAHEEYLIKHAEEIKAEAEAKRLAEEQKKKDRAEYEKNVKELYSPEKMEQEIKGFVDTLSKYDKNSVKAVISEFYQDEVDTMIDQFQIVFKDYPATDPMKQGLLSLFQVVMCQKIGDASHTELTSE